MNRDEATAATQLPHDAKAERWLIGGLLVDEGTWPDAAGMLSANDFRHRPHGIIFRVASDMVAAGQRLTQSTLAVELSQRSLLEAAGGGEYLVGLAERTEQKPGVLDVAACARIVRDKATLRGLVNVGKAIMESGLDDSKHDVQKLLDDAESRLLSLRGSNLPASRPRRASDVASRVKDRLERQSRPDGKSSGVGTGLSALDKATGGFHPGELVVIGGRPSMGKSALLANIAESASLGNKQGSGAVLYFNLDEPADALAECLLSSLGRIDRHFIRGELPWHEREKFGAALAELDKRRLYVDDDSYTVGAMRLRARQVMREAGGLKMIIVDSLQRVQPDSDERVHLTDDYAPSWSLKRLAWEMQCPVVASSALNRGPDRRASKLPILSDLRGAGMIEQAADMVMLLLRREVYSLDDFAGMKGLTEIFIAKHPVAPPFRTVRLQFVGHWARFSDLDESAPASLL